MPAIAQDRKDLERRQLDVLATVLLVVGALNRELVAAARFDLVAALFGMQFGQTSPLSSVISTRWSFHVYVVSAFRRTSRGDFMFKRNAFGLVAAVVAGSALGAQSQPGGKDIVDTAVAAGSFTTLA